MPDILQDAYVRHYLQGVTLRAEQAAEILDWIDGRQILRRDELALSMNQPEQIAAWDRIKRQVQSLGPRAFQLKLGGVVGSVNWGGDDQDGIDDELRALDLHALARKALKRLSGVGIAAVWAHQPEVGKPRVQVLGGHVEPLYREDDGDGTPVALYQVRADPRMPNRYWLRMYEPDPNDPTTGTIRDWRESHTAFSIGANPTSVTEGATMPRWVIWQTAQDGIPIGEFAAALPLLKNDVARQIEQLRVSNSNVNPLKWAVGDWELATELGADDVLLARQDGSTIGRVDPPTFEGLFTLHDRTIERIRGDLTLPVASLGAGTFPSGEALEQANEAFNRNVAMHAQLLSRLLTEVVQDLFALRGGDRLKAPLVNVTVNRDRARRLIIEQTRELYRDGLVSFRMAVLTVAQWFPEWDDDDVEAFIDEQSAVVSVEDFDRILNDRESE